MNSVRYSVRPTKIANSVAILSYALPDDRGVSRLLSVAWNGEASDYFKQVTMREVPATITYVQGCVPAEMMMWKQVGCEIRDISEIDLSFGKFWDSYGNKLGNKKRCEQIWSKIAPADKVLALGTIPRMRRYYQEKHITSLPFPETYLNQRRWENIYD